MTAPAPGDGKFVTSDAVVARFVGDFPAGRVTWVKWRILDVENELIRLVPSIAALDLEADPNSSDADEAKVGRRVHAVRTLVIDKVLQMYDLAKSKGGTSLTSEMDGFRTTIGFGQNRGDSKSTGVQFTEEELNRVRLPRKKRPQFGSIRVHPSGLPC